MIVDSHAKELAVINDRRASIESNVLDPWFEFHGRAPDLPAGFNINGKTPLAVDDVHHAVVNRRLRQLAQFIHGAGVPDGHQALDIGFIDLVERAVTLSVVAHALGEDVFRVLAVDVQLLRRLAQSRRGP